MYMNKYYIINVALFFSPVAFEITIGWGHLGKVKVTAMPHTHTLEFFESPIF